MIKKTSFLEKNTFNLIFFLINIFYLTFIFPISIENLTTIPISYYNKYSFDALEAYASLKLFSESSFFYFYETNLRGYPNLSKYGSFPNFDILHMWIIKIIYFFNNNIYLSVNYYIIINIFLTYIFSYKLFYLKSRNRLFSLVLSIIITYSPYFIYKILLGHFYLGMYFIIPLVLYFLYKYEFKLKTKQLIIIGFLSSGFGAYYYIYISITIFLIFFYKYYIKEEKISILLNKFLYFFLSSLILSIPTIYFFIKDTIINPQNVELVRAYWMGYTGGLKPITIFLPPYYSVLPETLSSFIENLPWNSKGLFTAEDLSNSLGLPIIFILFYLFLISIFNKNLKHSIFLAISNNQILIFLIFSFFILFSADFFSVIISNVFLGLLRQNNRSSILINYFIIILICQIFYKINIKQKLIIFSILTCFFIYNSIMIKKNVKFYDKENFIIDNKWINDIEKKLDDNSTILNLPYIHHPEMGSYLLAGYSYNIYLMSNKKIKISYGSLKGSTGDKLYETFKNLNKPKEIIKNAKDNGFKFISFDIRGFETINYKYELNNINKVKTDKINFFKYLNENNSLILSDKYRFLFKI